MLSIPAAMGQAEFYGDGVDAVECIETHVSWVFLTHNRVYKVKKPVKLPFLDYSTPEKRRVMCEREVELNSRLAPRIYRGVRPISVIDGRLAFGDGPEVVDYCVEMKRLPHDAMFDQKMARGEIDNMQINAVVKTLVDFHAEAKTGPGVDEFGAFDRVAQNIRDNFETTEAHVGRYVSERLFTALKKWSESQLETLRPLLEKRVEDGKIRFCHGDLRAEHLCLLGDGIVVAYDGIEFDDAIACCDVAAEVAFLAMDMHTQGYHAFARYFARKYSDLTADKDLLKLLPLYTFYRAHVRAKVESLWAAKLEADGQARSETMALTAAEHYHQAYVATRQRPPLILTYGLAGSGKSTLSRRLAKTLGLHCVRSDVVHKRLQGVRPEQRLKTGFLSGAYTQEAKERTYRALLDVAAEYMDKGEGVIIDASFGYPYMRDPFFERIKEEGWSHALVEVRIDADEAKRRLDKRAAEGKDASDATYEIYLKQVDAFVPPDEVEQRIVVDGTLPVIHQVSHVIDALIGFEGLDD